VGGALGSGVPVLILDPSRHNWQADFPGATDLYVTDDTDAYIRVVFANEKCLLIVDEAGDAIGRAMRTDQAHRNMLATRTRHRGHSAVFIAQRAPMVSPTIQRQCQHAWIFRQHADDLRDLAKLLTNDGVLKASELPRGSCIYARNDGHTDIVRVHNFG
jgi:hypothetical protein